MADAFAAFSWADVATAIHDWYASNLIVGIVTAVVTLTVGGFGLYVLFKAVKFNN